MEANNSKLNNKLMSIAVLVLLVLFLVWGCKKILASLDDPRVGRRAAKGGAVGNTPKVQGTSNKERSNTTRIQK